MLLKRFYVKVFLFLLFLLTLSAHPAFTQQIPGTSYTVKEGDTLWGITSSHYKDPFLWPKLWGENASIPHPDKIFPGEKIFLPSETFLKTETSLKTIEKNKEESLAITDETHETGETPPVDQAAPVHLQKENAPSFSLNDLAISGFILKESKELDYAGQIIASENQHTLLGEGDIVYVLPGKGHFFHVGEYYSIYQLIKKVRHPKTHRLMGNLIQVKGFIEIIPNQLKSPGEETYSAVIVKSYDLINLKDLLTPAQPVDPVNLMMNQVPFPGKLDGMIVETRSSKSANAQYDVVYLDKGSQDGVKPGHLFVVFREGEKVSYYSPEGKERLPGRILAELEVISVQKETATAIVAKSIEPIAIGDQVSKPPSQ